MFGRVTPQQKRAMVGALQSKGHVVAMTGDGVNDALALKDADIGVAMGSGAAATRAVAQLVLLDGKFSTMPGRRRRGPAGDRQHRAVGEPVRHQDRLRGAARDRGGRSSAGRYPFLPRHLTIVSTFTIGIPGLLPRARARTRGATSPASSPRCCASAIPAGIVAAAAALVAYAHRAATATTCRRPRGAHHVGAGAHRGRRSGCSCSRPGRSTGGRRCWSRRWSARSRSSSSMPGVPRLLRGAAPAGRGARRGGDRGRGRHRAARGRLALQPGDREPAQPRTRSSTTTQPTRRSCARASLRA